MPISQPVQEEPRGVVLPFALLCVVWGSTWIVIKQQIGAVPPGWTVTWRFAVAVVALYGLARATRADLRLTWPAQRIALLIGVIQICINFQLVYRAEAHIASGIVATLYALLMVPNAIFAWVLLGQRPSGRFLAGSAVAIAGIGLLLLHEYRMAPPRSDVLLGFLFSATGLLCYSIGNVSQALPSVRATSGVALLLWAMVWGTLMNGAFALATEGAPHMVPDPHYWAGVLYLGIVGTALPFPVYLSLVRSIGAGKAAYNGVAVPIVAMLLSTLFEGYVWTGLTVAGSVVALIGLLIALSGRRPG